MIKADNITKTFGSIRAVDDISFQVNKGEVLGFLGPNGAGKSTTMRILTGYLQPNSGSIKINGVDVKKNPVAAKQMIGYLPERTPVYKEMTVHGYLKFAAETRNVSNIKGAISRVVELCHLNKVFRKPIDTLSKGFTQRVCFAQALIHDPAYLILDEPTDGLDPVQKKEIQELIKIMGREKAILVSTHMLDEVEDYCSRVIIISNGKIKANGGLREIKRKSKAANTLYIEIPVKDSDRFRRFTNSRFSDSIFSKDIKETDRGGQFLFSFIDSEVERKAVRDIFHFIDSEKIEYSDFRCDTGSLTDAFRSIVNADVREL